MWMRKGSGNSGVEKFQGDWTGATDFFTAETRRSQWDAEIYEEWLR